MKGILFKAFSLALLISVVPSFTMPENQNLLSSVASVPTPANGEERPGGGAMDTIMMAGGTISALQSVKDAACYCWNRARFAGSYLASTRLGLAVSKVGSYLANTRLAGLACKAVQAPFDYTVGLAASKSGLASVVSNLGFVKAHPVLCGAALTASKLAACAFAGFYVYKSAKALFGSSNKSIDETISLLESIVKSISEKNSFGVDVDELYNHPYLMYCYFDKTKKETIYVGNKEDKATQIKDKNTYLNIVLSCHSSFTKKEGIEDIIICLKNMVNNFKISNFKKMKSSLTKKKNKYLLMR